MVKDEKSNKEILHPRVLGQHPLRLPPDYLPERSYNEIFNAIEKLEGQIWQEMEVSYQPEVLPVRLNPYINFVPYDTCNDFLG